MPYKYLWRKPNPLEQYSSQFGYNLSLQQLNGLVVFEKLRMLRKCKIF
jgi:hypothetical protein